MTLFDNETSPLQEKYASQLHSWTNVFSVTELTVLDRVMKKVQAIRNEGTTVYPDEQDVFRIYRELPLDGIKVVILGQDPYFDGNANGIAFACKNKTSKSLQQVIHAIMENYPDKKVSPNADKSLQYLVDQGVFLLNTVLTVNAGDPNSHAEIGWQHFTRATIEHIARRPIDKPTIWMLWGKQAQAYEDVILKAAKDKELQRILKDEHPAAAARNNRIWSTTAFKYANAILITSDLEPIQWI